MARWDFAGKKRVFTVRVNKRGIIDEVSALKGDVHRFLGRPLSAVHRWMARKAKLTNSAYAYSRVE